MQIKVGEKISDSTLQFWSHSSSLEHLGVAFDGCNNTRPPDWEKIAAPIWRLKCVCVCGCASCTLTWTCLWAWICVCMSVLSHFFESWPSGSDIVIIDISLSAPLVPVAISNQLQESASPVLQPIAFTSLWLCACMRMSRCSFIFMCMRSCSW